VALGYFQKSETEFYRFSGVQGQRVVHHPGDLIRTLEELEQICSTEGLWAMGYLSYEAAFGLDEKLQSREPLGPLLEFTFFQHREILPIPQTDCEAFLSPPSPSLDEKEYRGALGAIRNYLKKGETYQVNYTFPLKGRIFNLPVEEGPRDQELLKLWIKLLRAQACRYGGMYFGQKQTVLSQSPELFFHKKGEQIFCRPMKGTRANTPENNPQLILQELQGNPKDQAENLMIVDMIRNDLGKIAHPGSVQVTELFQVEEYPSVFQMVTPIKAKSSAGLSDIFHALFPCASITGAPKKRTMEIIQELEPQARGIYTGALGWIGPGREALFNVPIRTLSLSSEGKSCIDYRYSVGSGIVWDSEPESELVECMIKARFLEAAYRDFDLIEALRWTPENGLENLDEHLERMAGTAESIGEKPQPGRWKEEMERWLEELNKEKLLPQIPQKVKITLDSNQNLHPRFLGEAKVPSSFLYALATVPLPEDQDFFLRNKTSRRSIYLRMLEAVPGADQVILHTPQGHLTEGTSANLYLRIGGEWYTPPQDLPLLPGCHRARILQQGLVKERVLNLRDLQSCEEVAFSNDVRGWVQGRPLSSQYTL
jgi:para-aminobenzoate synthetase/4-amino-4-deoxychorismate lyase